MTDAHAGKSVNCYGPLDDDDDNHDQRTLTYEENGRFVRSPPSDAGVESSALRFDCPECDRVVWVCPVCSEHLKDDADNPHHAPGWFYGDSTGEAIACHNCNAAEAARQSREAF